MYLLSFAVIILMITSCIFLSCKSKESPSKQYQSDTIAKQNGSNFDITQILNFRKSKDDEFKNDNSPLPEKIRKKFTGLNYFEPSKNYVIAAKLIPSEKKDTVIIQTTKKEDLRKMINIGKFSFIINGKKCELTGYIFPKYPESIFIPFGDATNGKQTYEGGRYLDIELNANNNDYLLDFNLAYNPYCVYNKKYSCPLVPEENILKIPIKAGEKKFKKKKNKNKQ